MEFHQNAQQRIRINDECVCGCVFVSFLAEDPSLLDRLTVGMSSLAAGPTTHTAALKVHGMAYFDFDRFLEEV